MTKTPPAPPLVERLRDPGFTPRLREVDGLVDLLADDDMAKLAARAIGRLGNMALAPLSARLETSRPPLRARIVKAIGRLVPDGQAVGTLLAALRDADPKTRRNAAIALGHVLRPEIEEALLRASEDDPRPEMRRTIAASLGKVGTLRSLPFLLRASGAPDPELSRIADRARAILERTASRGERSRVDAARSADRPVEIMAFARCGLEGLLADELSDIASVVDVNACGAGCVRACLAGSIDALLAARTMGSFHFPLSSEPVRDGEAPSDAIARAVTGEAAREIFATWTEGPVRYRISWAGGGHKRAATWDTARAIATRAPELINDPTASTWEILVSEDRRRIEVAIVPRAFHDPRFVWRRGDVPAASHPTIAAALARVAGPREDDIVWDPFVGSGAELVERALLGPHRALFGSDLDPRALAVARENLAAAGFEARLEEQDALGPAPTGVTLIITNPPMGRRAARNVGTGDTLDRFVAHAAVALTAGGRLVWMAPWPKRARAAGLRAGLTLDWARAVDMGGFEAELQRWVK